MIMELFLDKKLTFEKTGMESQMSEDPNEWPQQILDQLYAQAPFTSDYAPKIELDKVDADRRYGMGKVELINKLAINPRDDATPKDLKGSQKAVIPIIVRDGKLQPLDILLHNGEAEPLTEDRLRTALFRPSLFEAIRKRPGDMSMIDQLYPPNRQYGGGRGPLVGDAGGAGGMTRTASANPEFLMDAILPTIKKAHVEEFTARLNGDPSLRTAVFSNNAVVPSMAKLAEVEVAKLSSETYLKKVASSIRPTVIQVQKIAGGFRIKTANPDALIPDAEDVDRPAAVGTLGGDMVSKVERDGTTTITSQSAAKETLEDLVIKVVDEFGIYKVRTAGDNRELVGWVFPKVMDFSGELLPLAAFGNGSESAVQENIAGVPVARQTDLLDAPPSGTGCFYRATSSGAQAFVPVTIKSEVSTENGDSWMCETVLGEPMEISKVPGLQKVMEIGEGKVGIPEDCGFMPLENETDLASSPDEFTKTSEARALSTAVRVITDGTLYTFQGQPIDKLAGVMDTEFLQKDDAVFLGAILGQEPVKLAQVLTEMPSKAKQEAWFHSQEVTPFREKYAAARGRAVKTLAALPDLRVDLLKEAAPMDDPTTVDKILSVGFLNPENMSIFASYVPEIEATIKKLAELLLATRLGLGAVEQGAVQKALAHLDKVVAGLKALGPVAQA
jgi:hypothetical protein